MIKQFRYPLQKILLEFPAGHVEDGENMMATAKRELLEETGYLASAIEHVYSYHPSVSNSRQLVHLFKATELSKDKPRHESTEVITDIEIITICQLKNLIGEKKVENAGTLIAYLILLQSKRLNIYDTTKAIIVVVTIKSSCFQIRESSIVISASFDRSMPLSSYFITDINLHISFSR